MPHHAMVPRLVSQVLGDLLKLAGEVIAAPHRAIGQREKIDVLRAEVDAAIRRPADGPRVIDPAAAMLGAALLVLSGESRGGAITKWVDIARTLELWVEGDRRRAAEAELRVATTDHEWGRKR